ncbi:MAG: L-fuconolactonase [Gammaproteobacteria bacterium]|jgi:L-fuconolactonase
MANARRNEAEHRAWIALVDETAIEPELPICDPHHHLWLDEGHSGWPYTLENLHRDTGAGHNIVQTVFLECHAQYRTDGPEHLRPVGETEFVVDLAEQSTRSGNAQINGIMGRADLRLGKAVEEVLAAHEHAGRGRFRGVRYITAQDPHPGLAMGDSAPMDDAEYLAAVKSIGTLGYTYDAMVYHPQLAELAQVARQCSDTPIVINHLGGFLGVGPYRGKRESTIVTWLNALAELAQCPNTYIKLGGIGMPMMGLRWDKDERPPNSEELADPWAEPIQRVIELFGPERCMFESNFPVDERGAGYVTIWNAFKRIAARYSDAEKRDLFHDSAARAYRLQTLA